MLILSQLSPVLSFPEKRHFLNVAPENKRKLCVVLRSWLFIQPAAPPLHQTQHCTVGTRKHLFVVNL